MTRATLSLLVLSLVLALGAFWWLREDSVASAPSLEFAGYASPEALQAEATVGLLEVPPPIAHPIDSIELQRPDGLLRFERLAHSEPARWKLVTPLESPALDFFVEQLVLPFKKPLHHQDVRTLNEQERAHYDLDPERAIRLTLRAKGEIWQGVDLWVGRVVQTREGSELRTEGTWVSLPTHPHYAWLLPGVDLRTPALRSLDDLRDRTLFRWAAQDLKKLHFQRRVEPFHAERRAKGWHLLSPHSEAGDAVFEDLAENLSTLRVERYLPLQTLDEAALSELKRNEFLTLELNSGERITLYVMKRPDQSYLLLQEGHTELYHVSKRAFELWETPLAELRAKPLWAELPQVLLGLKAEREGTRIHLVQEQGQWRATSPHLTRPMNPEPWLRENLGLSRARYVLAHEQAQAQEALKTTAQSLSLLTPSGEQTLLIAASGPEGTRRYACFADNPQDPFVLTEFVVKRLWPTVDDLSVRQPFEAPLDLTRVELKGTHTLAFARTGDGLVLADLEPSESMSEALKRELFITATQLQARSFPELTPQEIQSAFSSAPWTLTVFSQGKAHTLSIASERHRAAPERLARGLSGPLAGEVFTLNEYSVQLLTRERASFLRSPE